MVYTARSTANVRRRGVKCKKIMAFNKPTDPSSKKLTRQTLGPRKLEDRSRKAEREQFVRFNAMSDEERANLLLLREIPLVDGSESDMEYTAMTLEDINEGRVEMPISHAGGEYQEMRAHLMAELIRTSNRYSDHRTRRDRTLKTEQGFTDQLEHTTDAYMAWAAAKQSNATHRCAGACSTPQTGIFDPQGSTISLIVVDIFARTTVPLSILPSDRTISSAIIRQGVVPCSPGASPSTGISAECLELYRVARLRTPSLSIQAWVKSLCDIQEVAFRRHYSRQFSIAFDAYLQIRKNVEKRVLAALGRSSPDWRLKHACPSCTYKLKKEHPLMFSILETKDGNDSLKRVMKREPSEFVDGSEKVGPSSELPCAREVGGDRYLTREYVDKFAKGSIQEMLADLLPDDPDFNPCTDRWKNMKEDLTKRMWAVFDETGIFLCLCRHGFCLLIADMVRSGELAKYPLAIVSKLLDVFGNDIGGGYDIGCKFKTTLAKSSLGPQAKALNYTSLVGLFHAHAHGRICQLDNLGTYKKGVGIEDFETCERAFSKSNGLASSIRHASIFHRRQLIDAYFTHNDKFDVYPNLSTFLLNNYKQALKILDEAPLKLKQSMQELGIDNVSTFESWLQEEKEYLAGLQKEPEAETLQMEYWQKLVNFEASKKDLEQFEMEWQNTTPADIESGQSDHTSKTETTRRHAWETHNINLKAVQALESRLGIHPRWNPESPEWQEAGRLVSMRKYRRALDTLEGLIVARLFELSKMNRSQTGYALRKHIGKSLAARSPAIRTAIEKYNTTAKALSPPRRTLDWKEVVEYTFLADFDLLRDSRQDISEREWAKPAGRMAMDAYFKTLRAEEEIRRLNVEVRRLATWIRDEERYLAACEAQVRAFDVPLAYQIKIYRREQSRFTRLHSQCLQDISRLRGFSGTIRPGHALDNTPGAPTSEPNCRPSSPAAALSAPLPSSHSTHLSNHEPPNTPASVSSASSIPMDCDPPAPHINAHHNVRGQDLEDEGSDDEQEAFQAIEEDEAEEDKQLAADEEADEAEHELSNALQDIIVL